MKNKSIILVVLLFIVVLFSSNYIVLGGSGFEYDVNENPQIIFINWMKAHNKFYDSSEFSKRFEIFQKNKEYIEKSNQNPDSSMTLGLNGFADLSNEEFKSVYANGGK